MKSESMKEEMNERLQAKDEMIKSLQEQLGSQGSNEEEQNKKLSQMEAALNEKSTLLSQV